MWRGGGQKVRYVPRNQGNQTFLADFLGFCWEIPEVPEKFEKKKVYVQFSFPRPSEWNNESFPNFVTFIAFTSLSSLLQNPLKAAPSFGIPQLATVGDTMGWPTSSEGLKLSWLWRLLWICARASSDPKMPQTIPIPNPRFSWNPP